MYLFNMYMYISYERQGPDHLFNAVPPITSTGPVPMEVISAPLGGPPWRSPNILFGDLFCMVFETVVVAII